MLDPMPRIRPRIGQLRFFVGIENQIDRGIADGVNPNLEPSRMRALDECFHLVRFLHPEPDVLGLTLIRLPHPCRAAANTAVAEELGRPNPQHRIAESRLNPKIDHLVQRVRDDHHQIRPHRQLAASPERLVRTQLLWPVDTGLDGARDAGRQKRRQTAFDKSFELILRRIRDCMLHHGQRGFPHHSGRSAMFVPVDLSAVGIGSVLVDTRQRQRCRIGCPDVMTRPEEQHRMIGRNRIEIVPGRMSLIAQSSLVVTTANDPASWRSAAQPRRPPERTISAIVSTGGVLIARSSSDIPTSIGCACASFRSRCRRPPCEIDDLAFRCSGASGVACWTEQPPRRRSGSQSRRRSDCRDPSS